MKLKALVVGPIGTNCYLVFDGKLRRLFVIDPGAEPERILREAEKFAADSARILLTHAHVDHIGAAGAVAAALGVGKVMLDPADRELYHSPFNSIPPILEHPDDLPETANFETDGAFRVLHVPGHSPGGSAFLFEDEAEKLLFCGDSLFSGSIGRTDLPGGDYGVLISSVKSELLTLAPETRVFPGHGGFTTIGEEKRGNPYLR